MKNIIKDNKIYIFIFVVCLLVMLFFTINETNLFFIIKEFIFNVEYRKNFSLAESSIEINISLIQVIKNVIYNFEWNYDYMLIWGTNFFQNMIPFLSAICGIVFYKKNQTIHKFALYRSKEHIRFLIKNIFIESFKLSISIFSAYFIFYVLCIIISKGTTNPSITRTLFIDLTGDNFYYNYTYIYYLLDGITRLFLVPFIYSFFACCLSLVLKNIKQVFFFPIIFYFGLTILSNGLYYFVGAFAIYFNPSTIMVSGAYDSVNSLLILGFNMIPVLIGIALIRKEKKTVEI